MSTPSAAAAAAGAPMSFRDVLRIDVMRRVWYAQIVSLFGDFLALFAVIAVVSFTMHGTPQQITTVQVILCAGLAMALAAGGRLLLRVRR
jgi:hypothetical protein